MQTKTDQPALIECTQVTLIGSSVIALGIVLVALAIGVPVARIERLMVLGSVPWFLFWYAFCRIAQNIKIQFR